MAQGKSQKTVRKQSENSKKTGRKQSEKPSENGKKTVRKTVRKREENSQKNRQKTRRKQEENSHFLAHTRSWFSWRALDRSVYNFCTTLQTRRLNKRKNSQLQNSAMT